MAVGSFSKVNDNEKSSHSLDEIQILSAADMMDIVLLLDLASLESNRFFVTVCLTLYQCLHFFINTSLWYGTPALIYEILP